MADESGVNRMKDELEKDRRDVADLWNDALRSYKGIVGVDLRPQFTNADVMIQFGIEQMNNFHQFRHNQKKVDKLRGLFMANIDYIQQGAQQLVAAATPAFPPAAAIGTALTYMLRACKQVSADYDVVTAFFEDMNAFLQRITILESRLPSYPAYRNCLMDVFTALLEMCGFATKYIELGRFKKWILNMIRGEDSELGGARKKMDISQSRLQSATEYAILGNTEELQRMNSDLQQNQDMQTRMMESQTKMLETVLESQNSVRNDLVNIQKLLTIFQERRQDDVSKQRGAKGAGQNKPPTSNRVRSFFQDTISPAHEYRNIKDSFISETAIWIFDEPNWDAWVAPEKSRDAPRILALSGPPGAGKSHLAASAYDHLVKLAERDASGNTCVAHFYFRETTKDLNEFHNAINWVVIQAAEQNALLCEKINVELQREDLEWDIWDWQDVWSKLVKPLFSGSSTAWLLILLDGLDELLDAEREKLLQFLTIFKDTKDLNINLLCTTRPDLLTKLEELGTESIVITKEKQLPDLNTLIWNHLNNDSRLRKLSRYMKQRISSKLEEKADGMLYAEHMLRKFDTIGREPIILKILDQHMSEDLEQLYQMMLVDLQHRIAANQHQAMKSLLWWLAFSYRPLALNECLALLKLHPSDSFHLEEELQGQQLARFLTIVDFEERVESTSTQHSKLEIQTRNDPDAVYDDGDLPLKFQERSMRGFFRSAKQGETGLRTPQSEAHRQIFIVCSKILCGAAGDVHEGLRKYAANHWALHLSWTEMEQDSEVDKIAGMEALGAIMSNETNAAMIIEALGVDYDEMYESFPEGLSLKHMALFATVTDSLGEKVNAATSTWAKAVVSDKLAAFVPLAKGHIANWFQAQDLKSALRSYRFVRSIIKLTNLSHLIKQKNADDGDTSDFDEDGGEENLHYSEEEITCIFRAFEDIPKDDNAQWAAAALLEHSGHHDSALSYALQALKECTDGVKRFQTLDLLANVYLSKNENEAAYEAINDGLSNREVTPKLLRKALVTRGKIEVALEKFDEAIASYEEARHADPEEPMPGDILQDQFNVYLHHAANAELIGMVKKWKPMERLAWMTWKYDSDETHHSYFRRAAGKTGEQDFLVQAYEEVINILDRLDSAAPMRYQLAFAHWRVRGDIDAAKTLMNEVLDSNTTGELYSFTNEDPAYILIHAVTLMTDMIYEQFRSTGDRALKSQLFAEIKGLTQRNLAHSISSLKSDLTYYSVTVAKMARKMGPAPEFQDMLERAFNVCYEALVDSVGWNDSLNLNGLAQVLSNLDGLDKEARILFSAQFSQIDPTVTDAENDGKPEVVAGQDNSSTGSDRGGIDDDEEKDNSDEDSLPDDEGDLSKEEYACSGECEPAFSWRAWKGRPMYQCRTCYNVYLCEDCYQKRQAYNKGEPCEVGSTYCGHNHKYIKGPIEGWKGIKDGVMTVEGEQPVKFKDWLDDLKDTKWKAAWERFWRSED